MKKNFLLPYLTPFFAAALNVYCLLPWLIFIPWAFPLWGFCLFLGMNEAIKLRAALTKKPLSGRSLLLSKIYFYIFLFLLICLTFFVIQHHPFAILCIWAFALLFLKLFPSLFTLQIIYAIFTFFVLYDTFIMPNFISFKNNTCASRIISSVQPRNLFTDPNEHTLYFSLVNPSQGKTSSQPFQAFYKIPLRKKGNIKTLTYSYAHGGAYDKKRKLIFLLSHATDELLMLHPETLKIIKKAKILKDPTNIFIHEKQDKILILFEGGFLAAYHTETLKKIPHCHSQTFGNFTEGILSKKYNRLYAVKTQTPWNLQEINPDTCMPLRKKFVGFAPLSLTLGHRDDVLYVTDFLTGRLSMIDRKTFQTKKAVWVKSGTRAVEVDEKRGLVYAGNYVGPYLMILDKNLKLLQNIYIGNLCRSLKLLKNGRLFAGTSAGLVEIQIDKCLQKL